MCLCTCVSVFVCICVSVYMHVSTRLFMLIHLTHYVQHARMCVCMCVCMCVYAYACMYECGVCVSGTGTPGDWDFFCKQRGMFSYTGFSKSMVQQLMDRCALTRTHMHTHTPHSQQTHAHTTHVPAHSSSIHSITAHNRFCSCTCV